MGGADVEVKVANFPAVSASDVTVLIGSGAAQVLVLPDSLTLQDGSTSLKSVATVRFRTPPIASSVTSTIIYISMQFFSTTRAGSFAFEFVPFLTGKLNVTGFDPSAVSAVSDLNLVVHITNIRKLPRPFFAAAIQFVFQGNVIPATAVLSSDSTETVVTLSLSGPFTGNAFLELSAFDVNRGLDSASDLFTVAVMASRDPVLKSFYPTSLVAYDESTVLRAIVAYVQLFSIDSAIASLVGDIVSDVSINISTAYVLNSEDIALVLNVPAVGPGQLQVALQQGGMTVVNFSVKVSPRDMPTVTLVSPAAVTIASNPQPVSLYLKNFPSPSCGFGKSCFAQAIALQVSCAGRLGNIVGHTEQSGILTLTLTPPALRAAGIAMCAVHAYDSAGRDISAGFQINYMTVVAVSPVDGSSTGGSLVALSILGFGLSNVSSPSQLAVSFCGITAVVNNVAFDPSTTAITATAQVPAGPSSSTCACSVAVAIPLRSAAFQFRYYDPPTAAASPATAAQDGLTTGGPATVSLLLRNFPSIASAEDVAVSFGGQRCDGSVCRILGVTNGVSVAIVSVTVPACAGCANADITITYIGVQPAPDGFDPAGIFSFTTKQATASFVYFKRVPSVAAALFCAVCSPSMFCARNGVCGDGSTPRQGAAPSGGAGRLTLYVDGARAPVAQGVRADVVGWLSSVMFDGSLPAVVRAVYDVDGSRIAVECELPAGLSGTATIGVVTLGPPGGARLGAVYSARFSLALYSAAQVVACLADANGTVAVAACRGPTGAALPLRLLVINLPLRPSGSLVDAGNDVQVMQK